MSDSEEEEKESEFVAEDETEEGPGLVKKLRERLKKAVEEKQEYLEGWQRSRADFANYKREEAGMHGEKEDRIKAELIEELLPALDALELATKHTPSKELEIVQKQFGNSLKKLGIEQFGSVGDKFNPHLHEALAEQGKEHKIISVERSGYAISSPGQSSGDKIIRPAQVII
ncbi:MAG: nucleotide exchange factor GrpE [bacterium]|nr:nucleotide exchange factor GrpE [bacterium]